jgi:HSP20 family protein
MLPILRNDSVLAPFGAPINRLDALFDRAFGDDGGAANRPRAWSAPVAMWQDDDHVFVEAELPGLSEGEIDATVHEDMLYIRGERKPEEGRRYLYNGRTYGRFEQVVSLPAAVDADGVRATLADGVLRVSLPKRQDAKPRKIAINAS